MKERGIVPLIIIVIGFALILFLIGFFRSEKSFWNTVNYKALLRLPCGLTLQEPKDDSDAKFPILVKGYVNGCGWELVNGSAGLPAQAGTAQVFDGTGMALTKAVPLSVPEQSSEQPFYFEAHVPLITPPTTTSGSLIILSNGGGLTKALHINF